MTDHDPGDESGPDRNWQMHLIDAERSRNFGGGMYVPISRCGYALAPREVTSVKAIVDCTRCKELIS